MPSANDEFACFNKRGLPRGHFFSCRDLYSRGVWVGYLTPEKYGESYEGLASFNQLKTNCKRFSQPYPPTIVGVPGGERSAVCRGCVGSSSQLLTLRELSFVGKTKLVIMPLDGVDSLGMFCILLPQPNDRSLQGLQIYRPYEHRDGGASKLFTSSIMILTLRNTSQASGTLETVRAILGSPNPQPDGESSSPLGGDIVDKQMKPIEKQNAPASSKKRRLSKVTLASYEDQALKKRKDTESPAPFSTQPNTGSRETTEPLVIDDCDKSRLEGPRSSLGADIFQAVSAGSPAIPPYLTKDQSKRVCLVWVVTANDIEYCFSHPLASCSQLSDYFILVREDAADDQEVLDLLDRSKVWRLTYQLPNLPDLPKKAFTIRSGDETGYEKLLQSLAQCPHWQSGSESKIDVELRMLK